MSRKSILLWGTLTGLITGLGVVGVFYLGMRLVGFPFVPFDIFDELARLLPGAVITAGIDAMVRIITVLRLGPTASTAKLAEQSLAVLQFVIGGGVLGLAISALSARTPRSAVRIGIAAGVVALLISFAAEALLGFPEIGAVVSILWMAVVLVGWGWLLGRWANQQLQPAQPGEPAVSVSRREFLAWLWGGSVVLALAALGLSRPRQPQRIPVTGNEALPPPEVKQTGGAAASPSAEALAKRIVPAPGTRPELTPTDQFYRIDINVDIPTTDMQTWRMGLDGLVDRPLSLTLDQIRAYPAVSQVITLSCISNEVGGDLISTGAWTGVPLKTVLAAAGLKPGAQFVNIRSFDGFYESLGMTEAMDERTLLVYDMNGAPLPAEHGFPLRINIPGHYGMKQPKWIEHIEISDQEGPGYWVDRGWSKTAFVQTTSVIDTVATGNIDPAKQTVPVGGIAYAGASGISKVEVQMDNGPWQEAQLRVPPLSPLTWVQWRYDFPTQTGRHVFRVRAYDGKGELQRAVNTPPHPNGATGIHTVTLDF